MNTLLLHLAHPFLKRVCFTHVHPLNWRGWAHPQSRKALALQLSWHSGDANAARATQREVDREENFEAGNVTPQQVGTSTKFSENQDKRVMLLFHIFHLDYQKYEKHHYDSDQSGWVDMVLV